MGKSTRSETFTSNEVFQPDKRILSSGPASYFSEITYTNILPKCNQHVEIICPSTHGIAGSSHLQSFSPPYQLIGVSRSSSTPQDQYDVCLSAIEHNSSPCLNGLVNHKSGTQSSSQSSENGVVYDETEIRYKLKELERELLHDTDSEYAGEMEDLDIDHEYVNPGRDLRLQSSPRESSSYSDTSTAESFKEGKMPKQLLLECAAAISEGNFEDASAIIMELRHIVSILGDPSQRLAAYLVEGLAAKLSCSGQGIYKSLRCKEPPSSDRLSGMQILFEVCPCFKFGFMAANGAISELCRDNEKVRIIDFDINQGSQYFALLQALSNCHKKPSLRLTGVDDPESVQRAVGGLKIIGLRLEKLAEQLDIPFEFHAIAAKTSDVTPSMLGCQPDETLIVNFAYQLHHMPDESVSTVNQRDQLLRMVKGLQPKLVTVVEQDINTNTAPFFPRFVEVYNYYHAVFESLDATLPRDSPDRMNVERQCLAKDMVNIVACEGADRIERYEAAGKWRARMTMAGFIPCELSSLINQEIRGHLKLYCGRYKLEVEAGAMHFGWEDKTLVVASAWR